jgi:hypothetical protein
MSALALAAAGGAGACQAADLLDSAGCRKALDALQVQETAAGADAMRQPDGAASRTALVRLTNLRQEAARACLGGTADAPLPQRLAQDPVVVPRVIVTPARPPTPTPTAPSMPAPKVVGPPVTVTACDATGCWASDGSHLLRAGPGGLLGPRGLCQVQGTVLRCP